MKVCNRCKKKLDLSCFYFDKRYNSYQGRCKKCNAEVKRIQRENNPEASKQYQTEYRKKNRKKYNKYMSEYRSKNKDKIQTNQRLYYQSQGKEKKREYDSRNRDRIRKYENMRYHTDMNYKLRKVLRTRLNKFVNEHQKSKKTLDMLGCDLKVFKTWIEYQFYEDMCWDNYGMYWNIDHVIPCSSFDLTVPRNQDRCFHWTNMRPMIKEENESKNDYIDENILFEHYISIHNFLSSSTKVMVKTITGSE